MTAIDALRDAHKELKKAVYPARKKAHATEGKLASTFREAMVIWDQMKADGMSLVDRVKGLEAVLRDVWPFTREWKYICSNCNDYGLSMGNCPGDATCGRHKPHLPHEFGTPCWCELGRRFREKPRGGPDDFKAAGRTSKPSRVGR